MIAVVLAGVRWVDEGPLLVWSAMSGERTILIRAPAVASAPIADLDRAVMGGTPAALLACPCTLLTLSELSFTVREVFFSFGPQTHHEPVGRCVATIDLHLARVRPQSCTRDHRGRQWGGRRVASSSRRLSAADRGAGSLRRAGARDVSRLCAGTGVQL